MAAIIRDYEGMLASLAAWGRPFNAMMDAPDLIGTSVRNRMVAAWLFYMRLPDIGWHHVKEALAAAQPSLANAIARAWMAA